MAKNNIFLQFLFICGIQIEHWPIGLEIMSSTLTYASLIYLRHDEANVKIRFDQSFSLYLSNLPWATLFHCIF
jgi:hypothetical protein